MHGGGFAGFEGGEGVAEFVDGFDLFAIEGVDDVAGAEAGIDGEAVGNDGCDEHAGGNAHVAENGDDFRSDVGADDAEARDYAFGWVAKFGEARGVVARFVDGENKVELPAARGQR